MMLKYKFEEFMKSYGGHRQNNKVDTPILHYYMNDTEFVMTFRNFQLNDVYTIVSLKDIKEFSQLYSGDDSNSVADFVSNYLSDARELIGDPRSTIFIPVKKKSTLMLDPAVFSKGYEEVDAGEDVINESDDYSSFISKIIKNWENKVLSAVDKVELDKTTFSDLNKTWGEFLQGMMNAINTLPFLSRIKTYIKSGFMAGVESAENELDINIRFSTEMERTIKRFTTQQLDGYIMPDGKVWHGIKGATKDMQVKILRIVNDGVQERKKIPEIKEDIKQVFSNASESQANRIARTETNRFVNEGKLQAYKESGLEGVKVWNSAKPRGCKSCSPVCDRLDGVKADLDGEFLDSVTGISYAYPPAHPNCKSVILFEQK